MERLCSGKIYTKLRLIVSKQEWAVWKRLPSDHNWEKDSVQNYKSCEILCPEIPFQSSKHGLEIERLFVKVSSDPLIKGRYSLNT